MFRSGFGLVWCLTRFTQWGLSQANGMFGLLNFFFHVAQKNFSCFSLL